MRLLISSLLLVLTMQTSSAAAASTPQPADMFDFWIGTWQVSWKNADGSVGKGTNKIARILDGGVIEERFEQDPADPAPLLRGQSLSVRDPAGLWHQAWADNQGGFFALTGSADGDKRLFSTALTAAGDEVRGRRMVFHDITRNAFTWDWEGTTDGGKTWKLLWRIDYRR
jgi:hypothetical protein